MASRKKIGRIVLSKENTELIAKRYQKRERKVVATSSKRILKKYPTLAKIRRVRDPEMKLFMTETRNLLVDGTKADKMDPQEFATLAMRQNFMVLGLAAGLKMGNANESSTAQCTRERRECIKTSCNDSSWPCTCYIICNLTWAACIAKA